MVTLFITTLMSDYYYNTLPLVLYRREKEPYNPVNVNKELYNPAT
jgi:hypothetical protein